MPDEKPSRVNRKTVVGSVATGVLLLALADYIAPNEGGRRLTPYLDSAGIPTACTGIIGPEVTRRYKLKQDFTEAECGALETGYLQRMHTAMRACVRPDILDQLSVGEYLAYGDGAYNFGTAGLCKSPMVAKLQAGDRVGACNAIVNYRVHTGTPGNRKPRGKGTQTASGRWLQDCRDPANKCTGLPKRRERERQTCLEGIE